MNQLKPRQFTRACIGCLLLLLFPLFIRAEETNDLYVIDDSAGVIFISENAAKAHHDALIEEAKKTRESLPAKDFPEGNWGEDTNGYRLSLRFTKTTYTNGEPVEAILLLRNVDNQAAMLSYWRVVDSLDGPAKFQITSDTGNLISEHYYRPDGNQLVSSGSVLRGPVPGTQQRCIEHLDGEYHLTNGTYTVRAIIRMAYYSPPTDVKSAPVTIKIADSPSK